MRMWDALYMSDFFIRNKRTLNTMCLFYDRVFLHDQFGVFASINTKDRLEALEVGDERLLRLLSDYDESLADHNKEYLRNATELDALVLRGVARGLGPVKFSPEFLVSFAAGYSAFIRENGVLMHSNVLLFCFSSANPYLPNAGVSLDSEANDGNAVTKSLASYKHACLFEQERHHLPLVSDCEEDLIRWDRTKDLLATALATAAVSTAVPTIAEVGPDDILEARERLKDYLPPFRDTVLEGCWEIASAAREESMEEVTRLAQLYYETKIQPSVDALESKVSGENNSLFRKLLERGADATTLVAKSLDPTEPTSKWDLLASGMKSLLDLDGSQQQKARLRSPYEFLVRLPKALRC